MPFARVGQSVHPFFVEFHTGFAEEIDKLLPERACVMVGFLRLDVFDDPVLFLEGMGEGAVSFLPVGEPREDGFALNPIGRGKLDVFHKIGQRQLRVKGSEDVDVVIDTVDAVEMATFVLQRSPDVAEEVGTALAGEYLDPVPGGEDDVVVRLDEGGHDGILSSGVGWVRHSTPGGVDQLQLKTTRRFPVAAATGYSNSSLREGTGEAWRVWFVNFAPF